MCGRGTRRRSEWMPCGRLPAAMYCGQMPAVGYATPNTDNQQLHICNKRLYYWRVTHSARPTTLKAFSAAHALRTRTTTSTTRSHPLSISGTRPPAAAACACAPQCSMHMHQTRGGNGCGDGPCATPAVTLT